MVEFVSANPTGPLHVGHGRQAALGDAIATLLECAAAGDVTREFYYNDAGAADRQPRLSVQARAQRDRWAIAALPEDGYHGDYIGEIAQRYRATRRRPTTLGPTTSTRSAAFAVA